MKLFKKFLFPLIALIGLVRTPQISEHNLIPNLMFKHNELDNSNYCLPETYQDDLSAEDKFFSIPQGSYTHIVDSLAPIANKEATQVLNENLARLLIPFEQVQKEASELSTLLDSYINSPFSKTSSELFMQALEDIKRLNQDIVDYMNTINHSHKSELSEEIGVDHNNFVITFKQRLTDIQHRELNYYPLLDHLYNRWDVTYFNRFINNLISNTTQHIADSDQLSTVVQLLKDADQQVFDKSKKQLEAMLLDVEKLDNLSIESKTNLNAIKNIMNKSYTLESIQLINKLIDECISSSFDKEETQSLQAMKDILLESYKRTIISALVWFHPYLDYPLPTYLYKYMYTLNFIIGSLIAGWLHDFKYWAPYHPLLTKDEIEQLTVMAKEDKALDKQIDEYKGHTSCFITGDELIDINEPVLLIKNYTKGNKVLQVPDKENPYQHIYTKSALDKLSIHPFSRDNINNPTPYQEGEHSYQTHYIEYKLTKRPKKEGLYLDFKPASDLAKKLRTFLKASHHLKKEEMNTSLKPRF